MTDDVIDDETQTEVVEIEQLGDGIYLHLDEDDYHAQHRMSASGIKKMMASEGDFWASSWMNPDRENTITDAQLLGRAFHAARLEPHLLDQRFVRQIEKGDFDDDMLDSDGAVRDAIKLYQPSKDDHVGVIVTDADVKAELKARGQKQTMTGETPEGRKARLRETTDDLEFWSDIVADWEQENGPIKEPEGETPEARARRLQVLGHKGQIWCLELEKWRETVGDRTPLPGRFWDQIESDIGDMSKSKIAKTYLTGGLAEVSVLWTDLETGVKMKSRIDFLQADAFTDVKTFENPQGKPVRQCITDQFRFNGYYIQARVYHEAVEMIRTGGLMLCDAAQSETITAIKRRDVHLNCVYVFQQKRGVPNVIACPISFTRVHPSMDAAEIGADQERVDYARAQYGGQSLLIARAEHEISLALQKFVACMDRYGEGKKWWPLEPEFVITDAAFQGFWLEGEWV